MNSPLFDVKEETLPVLRPEDYADSGATDVKLFRGLQSYLGIIRTSA
jgi:hypothetical protein